MMDLTFFLNKSKMNKVLGVDGISNDSELIEIDLYDYKLNKLSVT